jgi:methylenetetrahydrofolate reductase (NADPH)
MIHMVVEADRSTPLEVEEMDRETRQTLVRFLEQARMEVFPSPGVIDQLGHFSPGTTVPVTSSPKKGIEPTLELCQHLAQHGARPVPHIAARLIANEAHLRDVLQRAARLDSKEIFLVGGDSKVPAGPFDSSAELLLKIAESEYGFDRIGIAAYPEGHPLISDETLLDALREKQPLASYMVTQMCFDPEAIVKWIATVRKEGIELPVYLGIPGFADAAGLLKLAIKIGVGESARFLKKHTGLLGALLGTGFHAERLVEAMAPHLGDRTYNIAGFHVYTFNHVAEAERWREKMIDRYTQQDSQ